MTVENLVVNDNGHTFYFSDPQPTQFNLGENSAGEPFPDIFEQLTDSSGDRFQLGLEMNSFIYGDKEPPYVCGLEGSCEVESGTSTIYASDAFSQNVFAATCDSSPRHSPRTVYSDVSWDRCPWFTDKGQVAWV